MFRYLSGYVLSFVFLEMNSTCNYLMKKRCFYHRLLCLHNIFLLLKKALEMQLVSVFYQNLSIYKGNKYTLLHLYVHLKQNMKVKWVSPNIK